MQRRPVKLLTFLMRLCLAALLTLCLFSALTPTALVANAFGVSTGMPCCNGKAAGHCKLTLKVKPPEPMCGLQQEASDDGITVVASDSKAQFGTAISGTKFTNPCHGECSTCAVASAKLAKRDKATPVTHFINPPFLTREFAEVSTSDLSSILAVELFAPRGPPVS